MKSGVTPAAAAKPWVAINTVVLAVAVLGRLPGNLKTSVTPERVEPIETPAQNDSPSASPTASSMNWTVPPGLEYNSLMQYW